MQQNQKRAFPAFFSLFLLIVFLLLFVFSALAVASDAPSLSEVLAGKGVEKKSSPSSPSLVYLLAAAAFFASFAALSFRGYGFIKKNFRDKSVEALLGQPEEEERIKLRKENKELIFNNEELGRERVRLKEERDAALEEKRGLEEVIQSRLLAEELMKKSNEALRRAYDKALAEKESLVLQLGQKEIPSPAQSAALKAVSAGKKAELEAVEKLISEVEEAVTSKGRSAGKKRKIPRGKVKSISAEARKAPKNKNGKSAKEG